VTLADGVPPDNLAATTFLDDADYPHDDHHRALAVAVDGLLEEAVLLAGDQTVTGTKSVPAIVVKDSPTDVRHPDFGGIDQTGTTDAAPTIQAAIDYILGPGDPVSVVRRASSPLYIPHGLYRIESPIQIEGAHGFNLYGDGKEQTRFQPVGTMDRVFDINGVSRSTFGMFSLVGDSTSSVTDAIHCRHDGTLRTTDYSTLHNIDIQGQVRCVTGIRIGTDGGTTQNDTWKLDDLDVVGGFTAGEATWWQEGIHIGTGVYANNLDHKGYDLNVSEWRRNFFIDACQFALFGFDTGKAEADFYIEAAGVYLVAAGGRSEGSDRLIEQVTPSVAPAVAQFHDIDWVANGLHTDGRAIKWAAGGHLFLKNIRFYWDPLPGSTPRLYTSTFAQPLDVTLDGISGVSTLGEFLTDVGADTQVHIRNGFGQIDASGGLVAHTSGSVDVGGGAVTEVVSRSRLKGDSFDRWQQTVDGSTYRGDGTAAPAVVWKVGTNTPEGAVTAPVGSMFTRTNGGTTSTLYVKETGTGNTGWVAK
jgi:hypothetical protein